MHGSAVSMRNELTLDTLNDTVCNQGVHFAYSGLNIITAVGGT